MPERKAFAKSLLLVVLLALFATTAAGVMYFNGTSQAADQIDTELVFKVFRGDFVASVVEAGDIESSVNTEIRCDVDSKGTAGTAILKIVPEGTMVKEGEFICQLDDSVLRDDLVSQRITVAEDTAALIQAESDLDTAQRVLKEYENGLYEQEVATLAAEVATAEEAVRRAAEFLRHSESLSRKGYRTKTQLQADEFAEVKAKLDLQLAKLNLDVYRKFTQDRMVAEYRAEIKKQEANVEATRYTVELSRSREKELERQVANCRIVAPVDGMVVYANETDRRGDASFVIEEGALIRDGQPIVRLPDPSQMQVRTKVNDSKINRLESGDECQVRVDTDPESPVAGRVRRISSFPLPRRWYQAPIEYEVFVDITEPSELIRSGLRAKVEIFTERLADCLQAPLSSLIRHQDKYFVFVKGPRRVDPRKVAIGVNNDKFVVITEGLEAGEEILVDADHHREQLTELESTP